MGNKAEPDQKRFIRARLFILLFLVGGLTLVFYYTGLFHFFLNRQRLQEFLSSMGPLSFLWFILLQAAQVIVSPIPGEATGLLGGYLYGPYLGTILSTIGLTIGSFIAFSLSRMLGRPFVEAFVSRETMGRFDYLLHAKGAFLVFLLFLIPGFPKDILCYILGLGHLSTLEFIVIGGTGRLFGTVLLTFAGSFIRHREYGRFFLLAGAAVVVVFLAMAYKDKIERRLHAWHLRLKKK